jgi:hypothetical protein
MPAASAGPRTRPADAGALLTIFRDSDFFCRTTGILHQGDCLVIHFFCGPVDAMPVLIHSPRGYAGVPEAYKPDGDHSGHAETWGVFDFRQLDGEWLLPL